MALKYCYGCMRSKTQSPICEHCGFDDRRQNDPHQIPIGTLLHQQYVIGRALGQGGFGITYIGWDRNLAIPVAIKEYFPSGTVHRQSTVNMGVTCYTGEATATFANHKERFMKEARTLAQLSGVPEIVQVKNFFTSNNTAYIVMEYVQGTTLKAYLKQLGRKMTAQETLDVMEPVIKGLSKVHQKYLIHRDISPDNIMLPKGGGVKLIDFGTVRNIDGSMHTKSTEAILKPGFAPLEQYQSRGNLGPWTDVYALCATMHYCMTGKVPEDALERLENGGTLKYLKDLPGITPVMRSALEKGLAVRIADRVQSMDELYSLLYSQPRSASHGTAQGHQRTGESAYSHIQKSQVHHVQSYPVSGERKVNTSVLQNGKIFDGFRGVVQESVLKYCESVANKQILVETYLQQCANNGTLSEDMAKRILLHYLANKPAKKSVTAVHPHQNTASTGVHSHVVNSFDVYCAECGKPIPSDSKFCCHCGSLQLALTTGSYRRQMCPGCKQQIPAESKFCRSCGSRVPQSAAVNASEWICTGCGTRLDKGLRFCYHCGRPVPQGHTASIPARSCRKCGKELAPGARFCVYCGTQA